MPSKNRNYTKNAGPIALAAVEEHPGAYMRLLYNVFRANYLSLSLLATHMRTAPVHADRKAALYIINPTRGTYLVTYLKL